MSVPSDHPFFKALLDWSTRHSAEQTFDTNFKPMSQEDQKFLMDAMASCTINVTDIIKKHVVSLSEEDKDENLENKRDVLEALAEICEDLDFARDLHQCGGLLIVIRHLTHTDAIVRSNAAMVCQVVLQNHPEMQAAAMNYRLMEGLFTAIGKEHNENTRASMVGAMSSLVRGYAPAEDVFVEKDGVNVLTNLISPNSGLRTIKKALFFLWFVMENNTGLTKRAVDAGLVEKVTALLSMAETDLDTREKSLDALYAALHQHPDICKEQASAAGVGDIIRRRREAIDAASDEDKDMLTGELERLDKLAACV